MGIFSRRSGRTSPIAVDPHLQADLDLLAAARRGEFRPLGDRLSTLRSAGRWHHRHLLVDRASDPALGPTSWIADWAVREPADPDARAVRAAALVAEAWAARSNRVAAEVSADRFRSFHALLDAATGELEETAARCPDDPTAWGALLDHARGLQLGVARVHDIVSVASATCPDGFAWRASAVEFLSPWWFGSAEESWDLAVTSAQTAPGSRLVLLPAYAAVRAVWKEATPPALEMLAEALPPAVAYLEASTDPVEVVEGSSYLMARLVAAGRPSDAARLADVAEDRIDTRAWRIFDGDPVRLFEKVRTRAARATTR